MCHNLSSFWWFFLLGTDRFITQTSFKILCMQHINKAVSRLDMGNTEAIVWKPRLKMVSNRLKALSQDGGASFESPVSRWWGIVWKPRLKMVGHRLKAPSLDGGASFKSPVSRSWGIAWKPRLKMVGHRLKAMSQDGGAFCVAGNYMGHTRSQVGGTCPTDIEYVYLISEIQSRSYKIITVSNNVFSCITKAINMRGCWVSLGKLVACFFSNLAIN